MRSDKQIEASRRNGALSRGPLTIEGKAVTSRNATSHGLNARDGLSAYDVLRRRESLEQFEQLLQSNVARFAPQDDTELRIVEEYSADRAIRRLQQLRQFHPSNPSVPTEEGVEVHFLGTEPAAAAAEGEDTVEQLRDKLKEFVQTIMALLRPYTDAYTIISFRLPVGSSAAKGQPLATV